jgi:hypothetical protein
VWDWHRQIHLSEVLPAAMLVLNGAEWQNTVLVTPSSMKAVPTMQ